VKKALIGILAIFGLLLAGAVFMPGLHDHLPISPERIARGRLVGLVSAERIFRENDLLGSGEHSYWRTDIAGFHFLQVKGRSIQLIELPLALADDHPAPERAEIGPRAPAGGYWYRSLTFAGEKVPHPLHFAMCAFPEAYPTSGRFTLIVSDQGTIYGKDLGPGRGVEVYPEDPLGQGWRKIE
jgi:hypothetical protein